MDEYELRSWCNDKNVSKNLESFRNFWLNFRTPKKLWIMRPSHPWYVIVFSEDIYFWYREQLFLLHVLRMCWYNDNSDVDDFDDDDSDNVKNIFYVPLRGLRYNQRSDTSSSVLLND